MTSEGPTVCIYEPTIYEYFQSDTPTSGGAQRQLYLLATYLSNDVKFEFIVHKFDQSSQVKSNDIAFHHVHKPNRDSGFVSDIIKTSKIFGAMKKSNADIFMVRGGIILPTIVYLGSRYLGSKFVYGLANDRDIEHVYDDSNKAMKKLFSKMISDADIVISQTKKQCEIIDSKFNRNSVVIPNGYPKTSKSREDPGDYFLWVGRIEENQKQPHKLLQVAKALPDSKFKILGPKSFDDEYQSQFSTEVKKLDNVDYVGAVPPEEVHDYYQSAIALINTSKYEGFPNTFLEAWRMSVPILSLNVDPNRFLNDAKSIGYANGDLNDLSEACRKLEQYPEMRAIEGDIGHDNFAENYSIDKVAEKYLRIFTKVSRESSGVFVS